MIGASIQLCSVELRRGRFHLGPLDLSVHAGAWASIVGESGSGKTSLLSLISGSLRPTSGRICIDDDNVTALPPERRPCTTCEQDPHLFPVFSVLDNIAFPLRAAGYSRNEARRIAEQRSAEFLVPGRLLQAKPDSLSGGEARRVGVCRALMREAKVILLDEVMNGLDEETQRLLLALLQKEHSEKRATCVFVSHDPVLAMTTASIAENNGVPGMVVVMKNGRVIDCGSAARVYDRPGSLYAARLFGNVSVLNGDIRNGVLMNGGASLTVGDADMNGGQIAIRAEYAEFESRHAADGLPARVTSAAYAGHAVHLAVDTQFGAVAAVSKDRAVPSKGESGVLRLRDTMHFATAAIPER